MRYIHTRLDITVYKHDILYIIIVEIINGIYIYIYIYVIHITIAIQDESYLPF
jgi:hypothetical protein